MADRGYPCIPFFLAALLLGGAAPLAAQRIGVGDPLEDYARVVSLLDSAPTPSFAVRPLSDSAWQSVLGREGHPWSATMPSLDGRWGLTPLSARVTENTALPSGQNDGLMWQGKGVSSLLEGGAFMRWGRLEVTLRPQYAWNSNADFELAPVTRPGRSKYANAWHPRSTGGGSSLDVPQRMGPDDYSELSLGESSVRLRAGGWALGASTEQMWWGPAQRNPIILSNNAPGFGHGFLGTVRPVKLPGGRGELRWIWGGLKGSGWSDSLPGDSTRYVTGIVAAYHPGAVRGLSVGATRVFQMYVPPDGVSFEDLFLIFQGVTKNTQATDSNPLGNDEADQLLSLFARYAPPGSGFEAYMEWGRNDHSWDLRDFAMEPEHSSAYTIGAQQAFRLERAKVLRVALEWTNLQRTLTQFVRPPASWYVHGQLREGWTARGQYLGGGIGTGATAQSLWSDLYAPWGRVGFHFQRVARENDALYDIYAGDPYDRERHQIELSGRLSTLVFWRGVELEGAVAYERFLNRNFEYHADVTNFHLELGARSRFPQWR